MPLLVFVDDDASERVSMQGIASKGGYEYEAISWPPPAADPFAKLKASPPDLFVLDLYLPPRNGSALERISREQSTVQSVMAGRIAQRFAKLYETSCAGREKVLLKETMDCLLEARSLLDAQWGAMGQHPDNGIKLLQYLRKEFPHVPAVFYSRKITPENVLKALQAGAADAIRKSSLPDEELLSRLRRAQSEKTRIVDSSFNLQD